MPQLQLPMFPSGVTNLSPPRPSLEETTGNHRHVIPDLMRRSSTAMVDNGWFGLGPGNT
jgi:hypothetical protein